MNRIPSAQRGCGYVTSEFQQCYFFFGVLRLVQCSDELTPKVHVTYLVKLHVESSKRISTGFTLRNRAH